MTTKETILALLHEVELLMKSDIESVNLKNHARALLLDAIETLDLIG
jgi:hypothetical protein